ncbi:MAG: 2-aminomuconate deaminase, partial [Kiritimatiellia bacterium]
TLSNRLFTNFIEPSEDHIHSLKDDEWNRKILEFVGDGRLEDLAQLSRAIHKQIRVKKVVNFKPFWWMAAVMGQHNRYEGNVLAYEALYGTGGAVATLTPSVGGVGDKEFDEDDVEVFSGNRGVLSAATTARPTRATPTAAKLTTAKPQAAPSRAEQRPTPSRAPTNSPSSVVATSAAPTPVGAYPHARRVGDLLYLSGVGPRQPVTDDIPGGPIRDADGNALDYDIRAQTRAVINNVRIVLEAAGSSLDKVVDVTSFLVDMDRDFADYNDVYAEFFGDIQAARTTLAVSALPTPIAVEFKVIARP